MSCQYRAVIPNSHQIPCNGFMLMAAPQPAMQLSTDIHYQLLSVRSAYHNSFAATYITPMLLSAQQRCQL